MAIWLREGVRAQGTELVPRDRAMEMLRHDIQRLGLSFAKNPSADKWLILQL
jgi:hypothetical protein